VTCTYNDKNWTPRTPPLPCVTSFYSCASDGCGLVFKDGIPVYDDSVFLLGCLVSLFIQKTVYQPIPLPQMPAQSQPPPAPFINAECYNQVAVTDKDIQWIRKVDKGGFSFGTEYPVCDSTVLIPNIPRKTAAKTDKGIQRYAERRGLECLVRRIQYAVGKALLKDEGFPYDYTDRRAYCKRCDATFFRRTQDKSLCCLDCGWVLKNTEKFGDSIGSHLEGEWTTETRQGVPCREKWLMPRRTLWNPTGKTWGEATTGDIQDITDDPRFSTAAWEYETEFCGMTVVDAATELNVKPNTLTKRISREELKGMFHGVEFPNNEYFCVISLKGENYLKCLGKVGAPLSEILAKFLDEWKQTETNAVRSVRKAAKKICVTQQVREQQERDAVEDVRDAYQVVIGLFVPDKDGFGCTYFSFHGHQELITAALEGWKG
jgi:hypothetical protein